MNDRRSVITKIFMLWPRMSHEQRLISQEPYVKHEVKKAVYSISEINAPGPDGFSSSFFRDNWEIVGTDVELAVTSFLNTG